jgi:hypothetical protein
MVYTNSALAHLAQALAQTSLEQLQNGAAVPRAEVARLWWLNCCEADLSPGEILTQIRRWAVAPEAAEASACAAVEAAGVMLPHEQAEPILRYLAHIPARGQRHLELAAFLGHTPAEPASAHDLLPYLLDRAPRFLPGSRFDGAGPLRLERHLGGGGFGEVYLARFARFDHWRPVVLKCALNAEGRRFLEYEALVLNELAGRRCHEGIVQASAIYPNAELPALTFPWLGGFDMQEILEFLHRTGNTPSVALVVSFLTHFARLLGGIHRALYVHRDIKPANILVRRLPSGRLQTFLLDWGIAGPAGRFCPDELDVGPYTRALVNRMLVNSCSPGYASEERRNGGYLCRPCDDVYSTGVVAIQALTGNFRQRVEDYGWVDLLRGWKTPAWFVQLLQRCVHPDQHRRPADGADLYACLVNETAGQL